MVAPASHCSEPVYCRMLPLPVISLKAHHDARNLRENPRTLAKSIIRPWTPCREDVPTFQGCSKPFRIPTCVCANHFMQFFVNRNGASGARIGFAFAQRDDPLPQIELTPLDLSNLFVTHSRVLGQHHCQ